MPWKKCPICRKGLENKIHVYQNGQFQFHELTFGAAEGRVFEEKITLAQYVWVDECASCGYRKKIRETTQTYRH